MEKGKWQDNNSKFQESRLWPVQIPAWKNPMEDGPGEHSGSRRPVWYSKITSSKLKNSPSQWAGNQANVTGLHGWTRSSWLNSNMKRKHTGAAKRGKWPRKNAETLAKYAEMGLGKPNWSWNWGATLRVSTGTSAEKMKTRENVGLVLNGSGKPNDKGWGTGCLLHLSLYWQGLPSEIWSLWDQRKSLQQRKLLFNRGRPS